MLPKIIKFLGILIIICSLSVPIGYKGWQINSNLIETKEINKKINNNSYYLILEIPKINLKKELSPINSENNDVNKNLYLHPQSTFPPNPESNVIIAGHSGNGIKSYFKNLYKLAVNDLVLLYYENKIYTYKIITIEYQNKIGYLYLKNFSEPILTLITCTKNDNKTQTIYYAKLISNSS